MKKKALMQGEYRKKMQKEKTHSILFLKVVKGNSESILESEYT
jgi:hypothetical protein